MKTIYITLKQENKILKHNFYVEKPSNLTEHDVKVIIKNANDSLFAKGWKNYKAFVSNNNKTWTRLSNPGRLTQNGFEFIIPSEYNYACYYPYYNLSDLELFKKRLPQNIFKINNIDNIQIIQIGNTTKPNITLLARQHPGESMGSFFIEGLCSAIINNPSILQNYSFTIIPMANPTGIKSYNHRLTANGIDLNRTWHTKKPNKIQKILNNQQISMFIDIHGDEVSKVNYIKYNPNQTYTTHNIKSIFQDFICIPINKNIRYYIKRLYKYKTIFKTPTTAQNFYSKQKICSVLVELSAHVSSPKECHDLGKNFIINLQNNKHK